MKKLFIIFLSVFLMAMTPQNNEVTIANGKITITDIEKLLEEAEKEQVVTIIKTSIWNDFEYPPILVELAKQNDITVEELVEILEAEFVGDWNPYTALKQVDSALGTLPPSVSLESKKRLLQIIIDEVILEITKALLEKQDE